MSLNRGKFGIEWNPRQDEKKPSGLRWALLAVGLVAAVSFSVTSIRRIRARAAEASQPEARAAESVRPEAPKAAAPAQPPVQVPPSVLRAVTEKRPPRVHNLLLRLKEAERLRDVEMAVSTIEQIRALPGSPAADLDDALARRLGTLNVRRLFEKKTPLWVRQVEVRRGDSASRIAAEHGSTFASFAKLNGGAVDTVRIGEKLYVMNHPSFALVVRRRSRTADLMMKDKFFKRYDLVAEPTGSSGSYELTRGTARFLASLGVKLKPSDLAELELLMPVGSTVLVSEL